jgi:hypothetical protein
MILDAGDIRGDVQKTCVSIDFIQVTGLLTTTYVNNRYNIPQSKNPITPIAPKTRTIRAMR